MPMPADADGKVEEVRVKPGDKVAGRGGAGGPERAAAPPRSRRRSAEADSGQAASRAGRNGRRGNGAARTAGRSTTNGLVPAGPATRRYAREHRRQPRAKFPAPPAAAASRVDDVKGHIREPQMTAPAGRSRRRSRRFAHPPLPDFSKYGPVEKKPVSNIRKKIAENLTIAWRTVPTVTQHDLADITDLEAGRKRIIERLPKGSPKVTMTVLAVKAVRRRAEGVPALQRLARPERRRS